MVLPILTPYQRDKLQQNYAVDIGYGITGVARFRGNIYLQRGTWTAVFRRIPYQIPQVAALNLPEVIETFADLPAGLVLVTGPTGSGKSTTLAAMVKLITERHPVHIVTIEDPIEYLFQDNMASVSQREMGTDTVSFPEALRNVMRQDPDVIMVGEMRDWETMSTAITAAETGHLVYSTLHHEQRVADDRPHHGLLPAGAAEPGTPPARARPEGDRLHAAHRPRGRQGSRARRGGPDQFAEDREADRDRRDEGHSRGGRELGRLFQMQSMNQSSWRSS